MAPWDDMNMMMGGSPTEMAMLQRVAGSIPKINPGSYAQGYEIRRALRGGLVGPGIGGNRPSAMRRGGPGSSMEAFPGMGGGLDPSSMTDPGVANSALSPYGLQLPIHTNPFLFFNDRNQDGSPTWAGGHPHAAKAVEGAMIGLTTEGGNDIGESISNVARTVLGIPGLYRQSQAAQTQAPFDMARQVAALQDDQISQHLKLAQGFHMWASGQAALDKPTKQYSGALYTSPSTGQVSGYNTVTNALEPVMGQPSSDLQKVGTPSKATPGALPKWVGQNTNRQAAYFEYQAKGGEFDEGGLPKDRMRFNNLVTKYTSKNAAAAGAGGAGGRRTTELNLGALTDEDKATITNLKDNVSKAEQESREKLDPQLFIGKPEGPIAAMNAEKARRQQALANAKRAYDTTVAKFTNPQNKTHQGKSPASTVPRYDINGNRLN